MKNQGAFDKWLEKNEGDGLTKEMINPKLPPRPEAVLDSRILNKAQPLSIRIWPDAALSASCGVVDVFDLDLQIFVASMIKTMRERNGVGLAANQVGIPKRVVVIGVNPERPVVLINPTIRVYSTSTFAWREGCLSVPGHFEERARFKDVVVDYQNDDGRWINWEFSGLDAFVVQHEMDHLDGKVFIDTLSPLKQSRIQTKIKKTLKLR